MKYLKVPKILFVKARAKVISEHPDMDPTADNIAEKVFEGFTGGENAKQ